MIEAGHQTVAYRLVDSYFGNISCRLGDTVYISQTGSSLDALAGCIDPCPLDDSSCAGITAWREISESTGSFRQSGGCGAGAPHLCSCTPNDGTENVAGRNLLNG